MVQSLGSNEYLTLQVIVSNDPQTRPGIRLYYQARRMIGEPSVWWHDDRALNGFREELKEILSASSYV